MSDTAYPKTPAAVVLEMHRKLYSSHAHPSPYLVEFVKGFMEDVVEKSRERESQEIDGRRFGWKERTQMMFYPFTQPSQGGQLVGMLSKGLMNARTYQVTANMCDAVEGMYDKTFSRIRHLDPDQLGGISSDCGFVWLDKPWVHEDVHLQKLSVRAVSWQPQAIRWSSSREEKDAFGRPIPPPVHDGLGWRITNWSWPAGDPIDDTLTEHPELRNVLEAFGPLVMLHTYVWPADMRFGGHDDSNGADPLAWLYCLWLMLDSEIAATAKSQDLKQDVRKRAQRSKMRFNDVNVVTLRRTRSTGLDDVEHGHHDVDWSCRWMVQAHWRHLGTYNMPHHHAYPSGSGGSPVCHKCGVKIAYIRTHLKGPEGQPLRQTDKTLYRLSK